MQCSFDKSTLSLLPSKDTPHCHSELEQQQGMQFGGGGGNLSPPPPSPPPPESASSARAAARGKRAAPRRSRLAGREEEEPISGSLTLFMKRWEGGREVQDGLVRGRRCKRARNAISGLAR